MVTNPRPGKSSVLSLPQTPAAQNLPGACCRQEMGTNKDAVSGQLPFPISPPITRPGTDDPYHPTLFPALFGLKRSGSVPLAQYVVTRKQRFGPGRSW